MCLARKVDVSQHNIGTYVPLNTTSAGTSISTQHQHIPPFQHPPQSTSEPKRRPAFSRRTPKCETRLHLNTTSAHTSCSTQHEHIRPFQHPPVSTSTRKGATPLLAPEPRNAKPDYVSTQHQHIPPPQHNISTYLHVQDHTSQGPRKSEYLSVPRLRSGNVTEKRCIEARRHSGTDRAPDAFELVSGCQPRFIIHTTSCVTSPTITQNNHNAITPEPPNPSCSRFLTFMPNTSSCRMTQATVRARSTTRLNPPCPTRVIQARHATRRHILLQHKTHNKAHHCHTSGTE